MTDELERVAAGLDEDNFATDAATVRRADRHITALESRVLVLTAALKKFTRCDQFCPCCEVSAYPQNDTIPPAYRVLHLDSCELAALLEEE